MTASQPSGDADRRGFAPRRSAVLGCLAAAAALATAIGLVHGVAASRSEARAQGGTAPPARRDLLSEQTVDRLTALALGSPRSGRRGSALVLARSVDGRTWKLAYLETPQRACWLLVVPRVTQEASCGRTPDVHARPLLVYTGGRPTRRPSRPGDFVVYGVVSRQVESLRIRLTDCRELPVSVGARPLFWSFVPGAELARGARPLALLARLRGGRTFRGLFLRQRSACSPGGR